MHAWPLRDERAHARSDGGVRRGLALTVCLVSGCCYVLLTVLVMLHLTDSVDTTVREWFRPDNVWGTLQMRVDTIVEGFKPPRVAPALPVFAVLGALARRSWRPVVVAVAVAGATGVITVATKVLVARPDPNGEVVTIGGSFPSGHTAVLLAVFGACLMIVMRRPAWWAWTGVVLMDLLMAWCLLVQAAHWFTDVLGGMLLATAVLAGVSATWRSPG